MRAQVLLALKYGGRASARELAVRLGLSLNAVRHHLKELEQGGLAAYERRNNGVGAPSFAYRLTAAGESLFPRRYDAVLNDLLDDVVDRSGRAEAVHLLASRFDGLSRRLATAVAGAPPSERLELAARVLTDEGFMAEVVSSDDGGTLIHRNCPIQAVAERFPEICAAEARCLAQALGAEVERRGYILTGCGACAYRVRFTDSGRPEHELEHA